MKNIDRYFGLPICLFLYIYDKFINLFHRRINRFNRFKVKKIIFLKWLGLGTLVKISPLLEAVRLNFPKVKIIFYTFSKNEEFLKILDLCDEIKVINSSSLMVFFKDVLSRIFEFKYIKPDLVVDLEFCSHFSTIFSFLSGAKERIGFSSNYFLYRSLSNKNICINNYNSLREIYLEVGKILGVDFVDFTLKRININAFKKQNLNTLLQKYGINDENFLIGINVNVSDILFLRRWPAEYFVSLINILTNNLDFKKWKIVLIGLGSDRDYINRNILNNKKLENKDYIINIAGILNLEDLIILMDRFKIFISNDSGPLYIAMMQNVPTVSFWGPTSPFFQIPLDRPIHKYFYTKLACNFCFDKNMHKPRIVCKGKAFCMLGIKPEEVADYILNFLKI